MPQPQDSLVQGPLRRGLCQRGPRPGSLCLQRDMWASLLLLSPRPLLPTLPLSRAAGHHGGLTASSPLCAHPL